MKFDKSKIKKKNVTIEGENAYGCREEKRRVTIEVVPPGMSGSNAEAKTYDSGIELEDEDTVMKKINSNAILHKEYVEYIEEGIEPDSDDLRNLKEDIEEDLNSDFLDNDYN